MASEQKQSEDFEYLFEMLMQTNFTADIKKTKEEVQNSAATIFQHLKDALDDIKSAPSQPYREGQGNDTIYHAECFQKGLLAHSNARRKLYKAYHAFATMTAVEKNFVTHLMTTVFDRDDYVHNMLEFQKKFHKTTVLRMRGV